MQTIFEKKIVIKKATPPEGASAWVMGRRSIEEPLIGNNRSSSVMAKDNPGRQLGMPEEEFMTKAEHVLETYAGERA